MEKPKSRREKGEGLRRRISSTFTIVVSKLPSTSTVLRHKIHYNYKNLATQQNQQTHTLGITLDGGVFSNEKLEPVFLLPTSPGA